MKQLFAALFALCLLGLVACSSSPGSSDDPSDISSSQVAPTISVSGSGFARTITISCASTGASIYFSTDGSTPTSSSSAYATPFTLSGSYIKTNVQAIAVLSGASSSITSEAVSFGSALSLSGSLVNIVTSGFSSPLDVATGYPYLSVNDLVYINDSGDGKIKKLILASQSVVDIVSMTCHGLALVGSYLYAFEDSSQAIKEIEVPIDSTPGAPSTLATLSISAGCLTTDGCYLYAPGSGVVKRVEIATGAVTDIAASGLISPSGATTDGTYLYISDLGAKAIFKVEIATGNTDEIASGLVSPYGIATDGTSLYICDCGANAIKKMGIPAAGGSTSTISTLVLSGASLNAPRGLASDGTYLYITNGGNGAIQLLE
jgi:hypothetical protein